MVAILDDLLKGDLGVADRGKRPGPAQRGGGQAAERQQEFHIGLAEPLGLGGVQRLNHANDPPAPFERYAQDRGGMKAGLLIHPAKPARIGGHVVADQRLAGSGHQPGNALAEVNAEFFDPGLALHGGEGQLPGSLVNQTQATALSRKEADGRAENGSEQLLGFDRAHQQLVDFDQAGQTSPSLDQFVLLSLDRGRHAVSISC